MQYVLLIHWDQEKTPAEGSPEFQSWMQEYSAFDQELKDAGAALGGAYLAPAFTGKSVRVHDNEMVTTDGPFAETREQLGGYFVIEANTEADALKWASKIPDARNGVIEVRSILPM